MHLNKMILYRKEVEGRRLIDPVLTRVELASEFLFKKLNSRSTAWFCNIIGCIFRVKKLFFKEMDERYANCGLILGTNKSGRKSNVERINVLERSTDFFEGTSHAIHFLCFINTFPLELV